MIDKRKIGKAYEEKAKSFLEQNGYKIIESNYRCRIGEIDIIGYDGSILCFIEVKYRNANSLAKGLYAVDKKKQSKIINVAKVYLQYRKISSDTQCRFDVVSIDGDEITVIKNAFP